jgi:hypothetical protein
VARNAPHANSAQNALYIIAITQGTLATAVSAHQHQTGGNQNLDQPTARPTSPGETFVECFEPGRKSIRLRDAGPATDSRVLEFRAADDDI